MLRVSEDGGRRREGHAASYRQLGRSLLDLEAAAERVFDAISERAAQEHHKLSAISRRIKAAKGKINALSRTEGPLTIISPAQHPSSCIEQEDFKPLFCYEHDNTSGLPVAELMINGGFNREFGLEGTLELFQFFSEENSGCPSKEGGFKARDKLAQMEDNLSLENLVEKTRRRSTAATPNVSGVGSNVPTASTSVRQPPRKRGRPKMAGAATSVAAAGDASSAVAQPGAGSASTVSAKRVNIYKW